MSSNFRNRFESLSSSLKIQPQWRQDKRILEVYRESLDKNFRDVSKDREVREWLMQPFQLDFSIDKKKAEPTRGDKLREILADLDDDINVAGGGPEPKSNTQQVDLNQFEDDYERLAFSRRHTNYGAVGKSTTEMRRFITAKMHQVKLKQLSIERYGQLKKIDSEKTTFSKKQASRGITFPSRTKYVNWKFYSIFFLFKLDF